MRTSAPSKLSALVLSVLLCAHLQGCGKQEEALEPWIDVSRGYQPTDNQIDPQAPQHGRSLLHREGVAQFRFDLAAEHWSFRPKLGAQRTILGLLGYPDDRMDRSSLWLNGELQANQSARGQAGGPLTAGDFAVLGGTVYAGAEQDSALPESVELYYAPRRGSEANAGWAITGRRFSGQGLSIWPGEWVERSFDWGQAATLRFATCAEPLLAKTKDGAKEFVTFRVHHGDALLFEHRLEVPRDGASAWHSIELPPGTPAAEELRFSVTGDLAYTSFLSPVITNADVLPSARRSDVMIMQADTFRADTLKAYGGSLGLAPNIEALMEESLVFEKAWSVGSYTLPAHASMMSGLYPRQAGIENDKSRLPADVWTLAESLSAAGYRTGAVVDSGFVSQLFGMHQGFAWFDEYPAGFGSTAERIQDFLDADDGRPSFLFVQTFAVHTPYDISEPTRAHFGERLKLDLNFQELQAFEKENGFHPDIWKNGKHLQDALSDEKKRNFAYLVERMRDLYFANIFEFDVQFAAFMQDLRERRYFDAGQMLFTSDHGESFLKHYSLFHGNILYEEELRVPFFLYGAGIEPRLSQTPVSLVDLPPTVGELTGLEPQAQWVGRSVLGEIPPRKLYAFQCSKKKISTWAQIDGDKKWLGLESLEADAESLGFAAFDLAADPDEQHDLLNTADWAKRLGAEAKQQREVLFNSLFDQESSADSQDMDKVMHALGYMGDEE